MRILVFAFLVCGLSFTGKALAKGSEEQGTQFYFTAGPEFRNERNANQDVVPKQMMNIAVGAGFTNWVIFFETASFEESSGNASLTVKRKFENYLGGFHFQSEKNFIGTNPYLTGVIGLTNERVDTVVSGQLTQDTSRPYLVGGGGLGLRLANIKPFWVSIEARLVFSEHQVPSPTVDGLLRLGLLL